MRLKPLRKDELTGERADLYEALVGKSLGRSESFAINERGEVRGPIAVLLQHPATGRPLQELAAVLRFSGLLPDAAREAVILAVAAFWEEEFEWNSHERIARNLGMSGEQLAAIRSGEPVAFDDPATQTALEMARSVLWKRDLSDDEYGSARAVFDDDQLVEITTVIGYYALLALQLKVFRIPAT